MKIQKLIDKYGDYISMGALVAFILMALLVAALGCGEVGKLIEPPDKPDTTATVVITGPPHHVVASANTLKLYIGEEQALPNIIVYDSTNTVIPEENMNRGWGIRVEPVDALKIQPGIPGTALATEELKGDILVAVNWKGKFYMYLTGGRIIVTAETR